MAEDKRYEFPKHEDAIRLQNYKHYEALYTGNHFDAFSIKAENDFSSQYSRLRYIVGNFAGLITRVMADMLFGENVVVDFEDEKTQQYVDKLIERNQFLVQLYESAISASKYGDVVFKLRIGKRNPIDTNAQDEIIIEQVHPSLYFPEFEQNSTLNTPARDSIITKFYKDNVCYLHKETHEPGKIVHEVFEYDEKQQKIVANLPPDNFDIVPIENTLVDRSLVFFIPNVRDTNSYFGSSDYADLDSLFFALNNRATKIDNILDKHSDPILAVPPGVIDEDGNVRKEALGMFEVDNENSGFNKPEYIVWNANLDSAFKQLEKLIDMLFMFSEIAPATLGMDKSGIAESGRALKFRLLATIRKRNRKIRYFDNAIKEIIETALDLAIAHKVSIEGLLPTVSERPKLTWGDGIINDEVEMTDIAIKRVEAGLSSKADEIAKLDDVTPQEAQAKAEEIDKENSPKLDVVASNVGVTNMNSKIGKESMMKNTDMMKEKLS